MAWFWLALAIAAVAYNAKIWLVDHRPLETDFLALLPRDENDATVRRAFEHVAQASQQDVLVLIGSQDWPKAQSAAKRYADVLTKHPELFTSLSLAAVGSDSALAPWWNNRSALLSKDDRALLESGVSGEEWAQRAMQELLSPISTGRIGAWQDDPFGTYRRWVSARAADSPVRPSDGMLRVVDGDLFYAALPMRLTTPVFAMKTQNAAMPVLDSARSAALSVSPDIRVLNAGMIFPAAAAAAEANSEFNLIGWGSLIGIILIMWITFHSLRPIGLVLLSLLIGTIAAVAVTALVYPKIHLLTLVFGASLIGVAEDYGMHVLCVGDRHVRGPLNVIRESLPGLSIALATTAVSFIGLGISPFPGLQQIALFSAVGLVGAWVTVVLWFPALDGPQVGSARVVAWFDALRVWWERAVSGRARNPLAALLLVLGVIGIARLRPNDDIRLLQSLPPELLHEQSEVGRILDVPFAAQFYVVRGANENELLSREEALLDRLDELQRHHILSGYQAISSWVPSHTRLVHDAALIDAQLYSQHGPLEPLRAALNESATWANSIRAAARAAAVAPAPAPVSATIARPHGALNIASWLASPISQPMRALWLGDSTSGPITVVTLKGVTDLRAPELARAANDVPGVKWADQVSDISSVLGRYRVRMSVVLAISYVALWVLLIPRYKRNAWRVLAPSVLASVVALATIGLLGQPLQLFHILGLYLVFGLGVDYAIFLVEHSRGDGEDVWFAVGLAATSTILSLGLLALSATPVLRAFGLTMMIGTTVSLVTAPLFFRRSRTHTPHAT